MKDILIVLGLGGLALYLFGSKSPSSIFTNPKIAIPNKVGDVDEKEKVGTGIITHPKDEVVTEETLNASGEPLNLQNLFNIQ